MQVENITRIQYDIVHALKSIQYDIVGIQYDIVQLF